MKKRHISLMMAFIFLLVCTSTAYADTNPRIYGDNIQCNCGDTIEFSVHISDNPGIVGCLVSAVCEDDWIYFDETVTQGNFTDLGTITTNYDVRMLNVAWFNTDDVSGNGTLFTFTVHVSPSAPDGDYPIKIFVSQENTINGNYDEVAFESVDGCITVQNVPVDNSDYFSENENGSIHWWIIASAAVVALAVVFTVIIVRKKKQ